LRVDNKEQEDGHGSKVARADERGSGVCIGCYGGSRFGERGLSNNWKWGNFYSKELSAVGLGTESGWSFKAAKEGSRYPIREVKFHSCREFAETSKRVR